ncbi:hypothetical protein [Streptomyces aureus]|uniref:hypothetical protein n=1 Tax=Streptomyces aureus TaxID=193461 RepID=UPI000B10A024|nr:hypothetical protein [Streptomyces aureus]
MSDTDKTITEPDNTHVTDENGEEITPMNTHVTSSPIKPLSASGEATPDNTHVTDEPA